MLFRGYMVPVWVSRASEFPGFGNSCGSVYGRLSVDLERVLLSRGGRTTRKATTMPVSATIHVEKAPISSAKSLTVISDQLQRRLEREQRLAESTRRIELREIGQALSSW